MPSNLQDIKSVLGERVGSSFLYSLRTPQKTHPHTHTHTHTHRDCNLFPEENYVKKFLRTFINIWLVSKIKIMAHLDVSGGGGNGEE
jgi:hypothetical protein